MIKISNLYYNYKVPGTGEIKALDGVNLEIEAGDCLALIGPNASGKSTLVRHLNGLLTSSRGRVLVDDLNPADQNNLLKVRQKVGMVFQNPNSQLLGSTLEEEVAFGPENLGLAPSEIKQRVYRALKAVELEGLAARNPQTLSGGQKQKLAIAGILAMEPEYLILDEPTSMLDSHGKSEVLEVIKKLNRDKGITVIHITHDLEEAAQFKRVIVMHQGRLVMDGLSSMVLSQVERLQSLNLTSPRLTRLLYELRREGLPVKEDVLNWEEAASLLSGLLLPQNSYTLPESPVFNYDSPIIETQKLSYIYQKGTPFEVTALNEIDLRIASREVLGIIGPTGSGKSTLIQHFNRLLKPSSGRISVFGQNLSGGKFSGKHLRQKVGLIFQFPENQLFEETVAEDLAFGPKNMHLAQPEINNRVKQAMEMAGLDYLAYKDRNPFRLSGGEMRWVAIAGTLAMQPEILVLDEPLAGLDPGGTIKLIKMLQSFNRESGKTVVVVSHALEELAELADTLLLMRNRQVVLHRPFARILEEKSVMEELGLELPIYTRLMLKLKERGFPVATAIFTLAQAKDQIKALANN